MGFEVRGSRFEVRGSRFEVRGSRFEVRGSRFEVRGSRKNVIPIITDGTDFFLADLLDLAGNAVLHYAGGEDVEDRRSWLL
jgi:hypothetical protein